MPQSSTAASLVTELISGNRKALSRCISLVENEVDGVASLLEQLPQTATPVIGITGAPGAGKSTLADRLIGTWVEAGKKVGVICVDPSSPFTHGALLGDRIRMNHWFNNPAVFIRSLATRGSLGGLHPKIIEITDLLKAAGFDYIIVETVGVGQSEIEIAGLADSTLVVVVPEAGDEIQTMKAGLMEIANIFVVNKSDRPEADVFVKNLRLMLAPAFTKGSPDIPIVKTVATTQQGIPDLALAIAQQLMAAPHTNRKVWLLAEKAFQMIQARRMKDINRQALQEQIAGLLGSGSFNLYRFIKNFS